MKMLTELTFLLFAETERRIRANDPQFNTNFLYAVSNVPDEKIPVKVVNF